MDKLLPLWIIGAPFVFAIIDWLRTPKSSPRDDLRTANPTAGGVPRAA